MGSPFGNVLAILYYIDNILCIKFLPDNILCIFENEKDAENFFEVVNCQHENIKFNLEKESNIYHF